MGKKTNEVKAQRIIRASALTQGWEQLRGHVPDLKDNGGSC